MGADLNDLAAFAAVARAGGFRDAARLAGVSASSLSEAVRHPTGNLVMSPAGDLYGVTDQAGRKPDAGTVSEYPPAAWVRSCMNLPVRMATRRTARSRVSCRAAC